MSSLILGGLAKSQRRRVPDNRENGVEQGSPDIGRVRNQRRRGDILGSAAAKRPVQRRGNLRMPSHVIGADRLERRVKGHR